MKRKYIALILLPLVSALIFWLLAQRTQKEFILESKNSGQNTAPQSSTKSSENQDSTKDNAAGRGEVIPEKILIAAPFTSQSPLVQWADPRQQNGCEEASILMAWHWISGKPFGDPASVDKELKDFFAFENENYGTSLDTSAADTLKIFKDYFGHQKLMLINDPQINDIIAALAKGHIVIAPFNGRKLNNPHYTQPGPERHMLVIIGYNNSKELFITNDPGTKFGENYKYSYQTLFNAIRDYPSGDNIPIIKNNKAIITVER